MELRAGKRADADGIADVLLAARAEMTYLPRVHTDEETRAWVAGVLVPERELWVAEEAARVLGFVALGDVMVEHLYVAPSAQGRGIGTALLALAKERRPGGLELWVFQQNEGARRFYERHGFRLVRTTDGAENEEPVPDALYAWPAQ